MFHIIHKKRLDILYENPEIPKDTHLESRGISISVKQQDKDPCTPYRLEMRADSLSLTDEVSQISTSTSSGVCPQEYVCESDPVLFGSSEMDPELP